MCDYCAHYHPPIAPAPFTSPSFGPIPIYSVINSPPNPFQIPSNPILPSHLFPKITLLHLHLLPVTEFPGELKGTGAMGGVYV